MNIGQKSPGGRNSPKRAKRGRPKKDPELVLEEKEQALEIRDQKIREE